MLRVVMTSAYSQGIVTNCYKRILATTMLRGVIGRCRPSSGEEIYANDISIKDLDHAKKTVRFGNAFLTAPATSHVRLISNNLFSLFRLSWNRANVICLFCSDFQCNFYPEFLPPPKCPLPIGGPDTLFKAVLLGTTRVSLSNGCTSVTDGCRDHATVTCVAIAGVFSYTAFKLILIFR